MAHTSTVCSGGTLYSPAPFQVPDRLSCNCLHWRLARQSPVRIPVTDLCRAKTSLKLCWEAACTICSANSTICRVNSDLCNYSTTQHRRRAMLVEIDVILAQHPHELTSVTSSSKFETNRQYCAFLKRIRSLMLMFCRNYRAKVSYSAMQQVICMQNKQGPCTFNFRGKTIDFQYFDKLTCNLHIAYCATNRSHFWDLVHHMIHIIRRHRCYKWLAKKRPKRDSTWQKRDPTWRKETM